MPMNNYGGLLSESEQSDARNNLLLNLGLGLLSQSGPSPTPVSTGQIFGRAGLSAIQNQNQYLQGIVNQKLIGQKIAEKNIEQERLKRFQGLLGEPGGYEQMGPPTPEGQYGVVPRMGSGYLGGQIDKNDFYSKVAALGGNYTSMGLKGMGIGEQIPSAVQEYYVWKNLPKNEQEDFLRVKRAQKFLDTGAGFVSPSYVDPRQIIPVAPKQLTPSQQPDYLRTKEGIQAEGKLLEQAPKARLSMENALARTQRVSSAIDEVLPKIDSLTAGPIGVMSSKIPGTTSRDVGAALDTIKANIGFDELNAMRQASPTGGALGQVSERELGFLQSVLANLEQSQSPDQLSSNLKKAKKDIQDSWNRVNKAYEQDFGKIGAQNENKNSSTTTDVNQGKNVFDSLPNPAKYKGRRIKSDDGAILRSNGMQWVPE